MNNVDEDPLVQKKGKVVYKANAISEEKAFETGVEWFTEVVFFYGTLLGIAYYEYRKYAKGQQKLQKRLRALEDNTLEMHTALE